MKLVSLFSLLGCKFIWFYVYFLIFRLWGFVYLRIVGEIIKVTFVLNGSSFYQVDFVSLEVNLQIQI